ncbi:Zinc finger, CCHC domain-containing protein [Imshaugia aleurites]|uniref:polynucleotide adenylyltransferase n=1 Tax=Imshaugia aleurites TaxID=172621 RepID=A0A8H3FIF6_9LECA|nr:Zinc finger, CCHC domain-containing protein [Imshaugia aleurites]
MAGFERNRTSYDGSTVNAFGTRPRVNLPAMSPQWAAIPPHGSYAASAEPDAMSLNNYFPNLPTTPQVNLPARQNHSRYPSNTPQPAAPNNNLEGHLRDMILSKGILDGSRASQTVHNGSYGPNQSASRRPNQAQRRQQTVPLNHQPPSNAPTNGQPPRQVSRALDPTRNLSFSKEPHAQYQAPHLRVPGPSPGQASKSNQYQGSHIPAQRQSSSFHLGMNQPNQAFSAGTQSYDRPPTTNRQLYNPGHYGVQPQQAGHPQNHPSRANPDTQVNYLESLAQVEISRVEISREEFLEKQALRQSLEQVCREEVSDYEMHRDRDTAFLSDSVELRCFGSLSTTFATKLSDMDLVLVSPMSKPELSSPHSDLPRLIEKALLDRGYGARLLTRTRVPIIRFCEKPSPELAALLLAERTKYEKERDVPPAKPKIEQPPKRKEKSPEKSEATPPQDRPNDAAAKQAIVEVEGLNVVTSDDSQGHDASESCKLSESSHTDAQANCAVRAQIDGEGDSKGPTNGRERDDLSLADKSDVERARLYKLAMQDGWYEPTERQIIKQFLWAFERRGVPISETTQSNGPQTQPSDGRDSNFNNDDELGKARAALQDLPNVLGRYRPPPAAHPLDFPKEGVGIQCDINFSNHLALENSHLLKCYASCDPRVRQMVLFVKAWSKKRKINTPYHGTLSSYGYVLMVLHYLLNVANPPVIPNLQNSALMLQDEMSSKKVSLDGYNIRFFRNEERILDLARRGQITFNQEPLGSLLQGFFHYFAQQGYASPAGGFGWTQDTLSLRTLGGIISKQAKGWTGAKTETVDLSGPGPQTKEIRQRYLFAIEDPFETNHNIARTVVHNGIVAIRDEFRRAHTFIQHAGIVPGNGPQDLFAEAEEKDNLQYRPFGPRPRQDGQNGGRKAPQSVSGPKDGRPPTISGIAKDPNQSNVGDGGSGPKPK